MKDLKQTIIYFLLGFITLCFISCKEVDKYDLEKNYCGFVVVAKQYKAKDRNFEVGYDIIEYTNNYTILKNNKYEEILLPDYYKYDLGDTICGNKKYRNNILLDSIKLLNKKIHSKNIEINAEQDLSNFYYEEWSKTLKKYEKIK